ncbi:hypothetical protein [Methylorubrum extorquens]
MSVAAKSISAVKKKNRGAAARRPIPLLGRDRDLVSRANMHDPYEPGAFRDVEVNRRVDVLAQELASKRIERAEFEVGRIIQAVFKRDSGARLGSGGWNAGGSRDQTVAHELAIIYAIDDAEQVRKFTAWLEKAIGGVDVRFLRSILARGPDLQRLRRPRLSPSWIWPSGCATSLACSRCGSRPSTMATRTGARTGLKFLAFYASMAPSISCAPSARSKVNSYAARS